MQLPEAIERVRKSIVQIQRGGSRSMPSTIGSGFLVGDPLHVVTAKHVVDAVDFAGGQEVFVGFALPDLESAEIQIRASFVGTTAAVLDTSEDQDLALLQVSLDQVPTAIQIGDRAIRAEPQSVRLSTSAPRDGVAIAISGYPLSEPSLVTTSGVLATSFSIERQGGPQTAERYLGNITANPGNSGGPVYTTNDGAVIGVCVAGRLTPIVGGVGSQTAGLTVIVRATEVAALLERNGIRLASSSAGSAGGHRRKSHRKR
jgi:S1-C subfamily serine protease